jgi:hypothetical protein
MIAFALALARAWVRIYTHGMPAESRDARRAEIECDLWEQRHDEQSRRHRAVATAPAMIGRVLRGIPSDVSWRLERRQRGRAARRLRAAAGRHRWTVLPALVELGYVTGFAKVGTPSSVDTPEQLAMAAGAAAILCGMVLLWRGIAPVTGAWLVGLGALGPTFLIARIAPLSLLMAILALRSAVRRVEELREERRRLVDAHVDVG